IVTYNCELIDYGYDGPYSSDGGITYSYLPYVHFYNVSELPFIWAEGDKKNSIDNIVVAGLEYVDGLYRFNMSEIEPGITGNYLKVHIKYTGSDMAGMYEDSDESVSANLIVGKYEDGRYETKYSYTFQVKEGEYDYMFRISNDYYWYLKQANAIALECGEKLVDVSMAILEGD
ncbi:MAG: hypothetical protein Q4F24_17785, partial [Eubacteriales bacterium]|nr:hypothetical protein [Eubacteriales bacterium]